MLTPSRQLSDAEKLRKVVLELVDTERTYVKVNIKLLCGITVHNHEHAHFKSHTHSIWTTCSSTTWSRWNVRRSSPVRKFKRCSATSRKSSRSNGSSYRIWKKRWSWSRTSTSSNIPVSLRWDNVELHTWTSNKSALEMPRDNVSVLENGLIDRSISWWRAHISATLCAPTLNQFVLFPNYMHIYVAFILHSMWYALSSRAQRTQTHLRACACSFPSLHVQSIWDRSCGGSVRNGLHAKFHTPHTYITCTLRIHCGKHRHSHTHKLTDT